MMRQPLPIPSSERERAIIEWVARIGVIDRERLVSRFFRGDGETLDGATLRAKSALRRLVDKGYLEQRRLVVEGMKGRSSTNPLHLAEQQVARCYSVTRHAGVSLGISLLPPLRDSFVPHHFKLLDAFEVVEKQQLASGGRVVGFKLEDQLVQEAFRGKDFRAKTQQVFPKFADARLTLRHADGSVEEVNLEYVSAKYTDEMIRDKAAAWRGSLTIWAAPNQATAARVQAAAGAPVLIV